MFGLWHRKKPEVFQHWFVLLPDFQSSTDTYYNGIEAELNKRHVPDMDVSRMLFPEGGIISARREYLRLQRERFVFDLCSAPFGTSWFFSCRFAEIPFIIRVWEILAIFAVVALVYLIYASVFGIVGGAAACVMSVGALLMMMNTQASGGRRSLDHTLLKVPVLGTLYELFIRRNLTYYREDTRLMYATLVNAVAQAQVQVIAQGQGVSEVAFHNVKDPMSPRGAADPLLDAFKATLGQGIERAAGLVKKSGKRVARELTK